MHTRRRTVATLAAAATAASLALVTAGSVTSPAHADARTTRLISDPSLSADVSFAGAGGSSVYYQVPGTEPALYRNLSGKISQVVAADVDVEAVSRDGSRVLVRTADRLLPTDEDDAQDLYLLDASTSPATRTLVSSAGGNSTASFGAASPDLDRVVYQADATYVADGAATPQRLGGPGSQFNAASPDAQAVAYSYDGQVQRVIGSPTNPPTPIQATFVQALSSDGLSGITSSTQGVGAFSSPATTTTTVTPTIVATGVEFLGASSDLRSVYVVDEGQNVRRVDVNGATTSTLLVPGSSNQELQFNAATADRGMVYTVTSASGVGLFRVSGSAVVSDLGAGLGGTPRFGTLTSAGSVLFDVQGADLAELGVYSVDANGIRDQIAAAAAYAGSTADAATVWYVAGETERLFASTASPSTAPAPGTPATATPTPTTTTTTTTTPPTAEVEGKKVQQNDGRIEVGVTCTAAVPCRVTGSGTIAVTVPTARGRKKYTVKAPTSVVAPGQDRVIAFKVRKKVKKAAAKSLKNGGKVKATLLLTVADASGNDRVIAFKVRLK
ncbi:hypothetical protein [Nocardioides flavescens]|uniref:WD40-like Beta Propeller Repeat n=1 Tax=Nocardioides flavescens TaxID=2691959 RepID=A0A6L7EXA3_9ACTN|nr:hypothetical protein [Nocardioides flavescens]MXG88689.1 hypothetical protein [Nocardioides flavescens]